MKYRLKRDPSVTCEADPATISTLEPFFSTSWEPVPEEKPADSSLGPDLAPWPKRKPIEDRCSDLAKELTINATPYNSACAAVLASTLDEAAAEIRRLKRVVVAKNDGSARRSIRAF